MLRLDREAAANPFVNGHGSQQRDSAHRAQDPRHRPPVARTLGVAASPLEFLLHGLEPQAKPVRVREQHRCGQEPELIAARLEHRSRPLRDLEHLPALDRGIKVQPEDGPLDLHSHLKPLVARRLGKRLGLGQDRVGSGRVSLLPRDGAKLEKSLGPRLRVGLEQRRRTLQQLECGRHVAPGERTPTRLGQMRPGTHRELVRGVAHATQLHAQAGGQLEVVADDLLEFADLLGELLLEPVGELLVQPGADHLGDSVVGGDADQVVPEREHVPASVGPDRTHEVLADE
jgi:hypothetical protein